MYIFKGGGELRVFLLGFVIGLLVEVKLFLLEIYLFGIWYVVNGLIF